MHRLVSDAPVPDQIQAVVDAYKSHGIVLHIDPQHTAIPEAPIFFDVSSEADSGCRQLGYVNFSNLKAQYFLPSSSKPWHYAVFAQFLSGQYAFYFCGGSGFATLPGYDFVVTLGNIKWVQCSYGASLRRLYRKPAGAGASRCWRPALSCTSWTTISACVMAARTTSITSRTSLAPNFLSVMNYYWNLSGIYYAVASDSVRVAGRRLDYSNQTLPTLDEVYNLDENVGIQGTPITRISPHTAIRKTITSTTTCSCPYLLQLQLA